MPAANCRWAPLEARAHVPAKVAGNQISLVALQPRRLLTTAIVRDNFVWIALTTASYDAKRRCGADFGSSSRPDGHILHFSLRVTTQNVAAEAILVVTPVRKAIFRAPRRELRRKTRLWSRFR